MSEPDDPLSADRPFTVIYDGECPFCQAYIRMTRLKASLGEVALIDARQDAAAVTALREAGYEINEGMVVLDRGRVHYGEDAMHVLALVTTPSDLFNKATSWVFARPALARRAYPVFKAARRLVLTVLRRPLI